MCFGHRKGDGEMAGGTWNTHMVRYWRAATLHIVHTRARTHAHTHRTLVKIIIEMFVVNEVVDFERLFMAQHYYRAIVWDVNVKWTFTAIVMLLIECRLTLYGFLPLPLDRYLRYAETG